MENKQGFIDELKEDARTAWNYIKKNAYKIGSYALLTLTLSGITEAEDKKLSQVKEEYKTSLSKEQHLSNKLENKNDTNKTANFETFMNMFQEITPEAKAEQTYANLNKNSVVPQKFSLEELIEKAGISKEDIQVVLSENKELFKDLTPGIRATRLARSADKVTGKNNGNCLYGAQQIFQGAHLGEILTGENPDWPNKIKGCAYNSAFNAHIPLEKSGKFVNITLENTAYNKPSISAENQELKAFSRQLPAGAIIITDNKVADEHLGRRYKDLEKMYGKGGKIHGHIAIKDNLGLYKEEGVALAPSFSQYGKDFKVCLSTDYIVSEQLAKKLIAQKEKRLNKEKEQENQNKNNFSVLQMKAQSNGVGYGK
ncbi:MAG: hypothetical protein IKW58_00900 [Alphaproteobacteria bacterium]|nr:hypothetical protein [Alphaproteobacteria bacterium]